MAGSCYEGCNFVRPLPSMMAGRKLSVLDQLPFSRSCWTGAGCNQRVWLHGGLVGATLKTIPELQPSCCQRLTGLLRTTHLKGYCKLSYVINAPRSTPGL